MSCMHPDRVFDSGFEVCLSCGRTTNDLMLDGIDVNIRLSGYKTAFEERDFDKNYRVLLDCVTNANLPQKFADLAYTKYEAISEAVQTLQHEQTIQAKLYASLYQVLLENFCGHSYKELAAYSDVSAESISHAHKKYFFENSTETNTYMHQNAIS